MKPSLRALILGVSSVAIVVVTLGGLAVNLRDRSTAARMRLSEQTERLASAAGPLLLDALVVGDLARAEQMLRSLNAESVWSRVTLYESDGHTLILDASPENLKPSGAPRWVKRLMPVKLEEHWVVIAAAPVVYGVLAVTPSLQSLENDLWVEIRTMITVTGVLLVTLVGLTHVILLVGLRPVRALAESAARLGSGDLTARMQETSLSEMAPTVRAFNSMAASLEQALHEARTREARLESLVEISGDLSRMEELDSLLGRIAQACGRLVNTDWAGFRLVDGDELAIAGTLEHSDFSVSQRLKIGNGLAGTVAATGEPLLVRDPGNDPRMHPEDAREVRRFGSRSFLGVPAKIGDRVVGVLSFQTRREEGFSLEDMAIATAFASHAAIAVENRRLLLEARRAYDELAETQGQLEQVQKMEAIGRLAGGVAHDFNNLLTVIGGYAGLLEQSGAADPSVREAADEITAAADRAAGLTRQLLALSRRQLATPKAVDVNALITGLEPMLRRTLPESIEIELSLDASLPAVEADPSQLDQVLLNLSLNARDAMPQRGHLRIETRRGIGGRLVHLVVSDTGVGMSEATRLRAFEPFFTTKPAGEGSGLGLSTTYGIVRQIGGSIMLESAPGCGTRVIIDLPAASTAASRAAVSPRPRAASVSVDASILLVEDDPAVRRLLTVMLEGSGYRVLSASNGAEALELARNGSLAIDLVLSDYVLPGISGVELCTALRGSRPGVRVVLMTGHAEIPRGGATLPEGAVLLGKPFTRDQLEEALERQLAAA